MKAFLALESVRGTIVQILTVGAIPAALGIAIAARPATGRGDQKQDPSSYLSTLEDVEDQGRASFMENPEHHRNCSACLALLRGQGHSAGERLRTPAGKNAPSTAR